MTRRLVYTEDRTLPPSGLRCKSDSLPSIDIPAIPPITPRPPFPDTAFPCLGRKPRGLPLDGWLIIDKPLRPHQHGTWSTASAPSLLTPRRLAMAARSTRSPPASSPSRSERPSRLSPTSADGTKLVSLRRSASAEASDNTDDADGQVTATTDARPSRRRNPRSTSETRGSHRRRSPRSSQPSRWPANAPTTWPVTAAPRCSNPGRPASTGSNLSTAPTRITPSSRSPRAKASTCAASPATWPRPAVHGVISNSAGVYGSGLAFRKPRRSALDKLQQPEDTLPASRTSCFRSRPRWPTSRRWP